MLCPLPAKVAHRPPVSNLCLYEWLHPLPETINQLNMIWSMFLFANELMINCVFRRPPSSGGAVPPRAAPRRPRPQRCSERDKWGQRLCLFFD